MFESCENALQIIVLMFCAIVALYLVIKQQRLTWMYLVLFYGSWLLGDLYWLLCLVFFDRTPQISLVSDVSWCASYLFLNMLLRQVVPQEETKKFSLIPWFGPLFAAVMALYFMQWGQIVSNLMCAALMAPLLFTVIQKLTGQQQHAKYLPLCVCILVFCLLEYGLWLSSCFFTGASLSNPYYWFDLLLTVSFPFLLLATKKAVAV